MDDWKLTLLVSFVSLSAAIFTGDVVGILLFCGFYYIALMTFNKEKYDEQQCISTAVYSDYAPNGSDSA